MKASRIAAIFFAGAVCVAPAWGAEAARALAPASGAAATSMDKCPMHEVRHEAMHKPGEPCPLGGHKAGMPDECKTHAKKDCMEKAGEPCPWPRDAKHKGKVADACDPAKCSEKAAKQEH